MKAKAEILKADGTSVVVAPENGTDFNLDELQKIVDGFIEIVPIYGARRMFGSDKIMVVNEEGKLNGLPFNLSATLLVRADGIDDIIVGDVLVCDSSMVK